MMGKEKKYLLNSMGSLDYVETEQSSDMARLLPSVSMSDPEPAQLSVTIRVSRKINVFRYLRIKSNSP